MEIYTIGFTKTTAADFFGRLKSAGIRRLIDVRLNNVSQLAGFAKKDDLAYFLRELCDAEYVHAPLLAPTRELLDSLKKRKGSWEEYEAGFMELLRQRRVEEKLAPAYFEGPSVLLCSEDTAVHCHRRLVLEYLAEKWPSASVNAVHL